MSKPKTLLETGDDGLPAAKVKSHRDRVFDQAAAFARRDERFRRDLLAVLRASGRKQRGGAVPGGEHAHILAAFDYAWRRLLDAGQRPTIRLAVDMLVAGPFSDRDHESLTKLLRKLRSQRSTPI